MLQMKRFVLFPPGCAGEGMGLKAGGFLLSLLLTAGVPSLVCTTPPQEVHGGTDVNIKPVVLTKVT